VVSRPGISFAVTLTPGDNLIIQGIPPIPVTIAELANRYTEFRSAAVFSWHPRRREMLIGTRFADTVQVHEVKMPGGARKQLTFFPDRVSGLLTIRTSAIILS